jgi:general secretion pathway protein A
MYCDFYQMTERPFNVTPDPKFLYLNARYREAIASLNYGITQRKGFITLIGEAGTGKTTLLKKILEDLDPKTRTVFIFNTNVTFEEILEYIFAEFDLPVLNGRKLYMLQRLNAFLLEELRKGGNVALLIDEAQDLEFSVLEDLRLLSNLETAKEKILQIVLSGQPELGQKLSNPGLRQLRQRIGINCRLPPLSRDEVTEYIQYRLEATHCPDLKLFSREAEDQIFRFSRGIPRLVNVVSDNALVIGYALGRKRIDADIIAEAAADLMSIEPQLGDARDAPVATAAPIVPARLPSRWLARLGGSAVAVAVALIGLLSVGRTMLNKRAEEQIAAAPARLEVIRPGSEPRDTGVKPPPPHADSGGDQLGASADAAPPPVEKAAVAPAPELPAAHASKQDGHREADDRQEKVREPEAVPPRPEVGLSPKADMPLHPEVAVAKPDVELAKQEEAAVSPPQVAVRAMPGAVLQQPEGAVLPTPQPGPSTQEAGAPKPQAMLLKPEVARTKGAGLPNGMEFAGGNGSPRLDGIRFTPVVARVGDSISAIARREYGQASYTILDLLELANPELPNLDTIAIGQTIRLPLLSDGFPILVDGSGKYALLVVSTPQQRRAAALQNALRSHGFPASVMVGSAGLGRPLYRVVVPGSAGRDDAVGIGKQVQKVFREDKRLAQFGG